MKQFSPFILTFLATIAAYLAGLTATLGAHPFWADNVLWIGVAIGTGLAAVLSRTRLSRMARSASAAVLTLSSFMLASLGKTRFAASYADDALAGHLWYFGWIGTCCFAAALLASTVWPSRHNL